MASDGEAGDYFGWSVSISGDYALVGAYGDDDNGNSSGSAYIFHYNSSSWVQDAKITADDGAEADSFGYSVSINGSFIVVGSEYDDDNGTDSGSVYIFRDNGSVWVQDQKISAYDGASYDHFGGSVSISGNYIIAGAYGDDDYAANTGSSYLFYYNGVTWINYAKIIACYWASGDYFGWSVCTDGFNVFAGAHRDDVFGSNSGAAFIYDISALPTPDPTETLTITPTCTQTATPTQTATWTSTWTPTNTPTSTPTWTPTNTPTETPTNTPTLTPTPTETPTGIPTATPTETPILGSPTPSPTAKPIPTSDPVGLGILLLFLSGLLGIGSIKKRR
ncbi:FG-GAP repeat protein [bacterium]|nr:FG-GAP repeat protein [bacterium]